MTAGTGFKSLIKFGEISVALREDGIIHLTVGPNLEITISDVKRIAQAMCEIGEGKKYPVMIVAGENTLPTDEARQYIATAESNLYASAEGYVLNSLPQKLVGNFFLAFNKPARPTKIFTEEQNAIEWLKAFL